MAYDMWGSSSNPGPNAPLSNLCGNSTSPNANAEGAIQAWLRAGMPAKQITLGIPAYGYISLSSVEQLSSRDFGTGPSLVSGSGQSTHQWYAPNPQDIVSEIATTVKVLNEDGGSTYGQVPFNELVKQGALVRDEQGKFKGANGFERHWDECSNTPWLKSATQLQLITYDDPESMELKGELARQYGILGVNMFDVHGDTASWDLIDAARKGFGV